MWFPVNFTPAINDDVGNSTTTWNVELANGGKRLVAASSNSITIYDITLVDAIPSWTKKVEIESPSHYDGHGGRLSMSDDGRFLATQWSSNQVKVWQIPTEKDGSERNDSFQNEDNDSTAYQVGGEGVWILCEDGISSLKLEHAQGNLYMVVGCDSYLYNRGQVQTFKLSFDDTWQTFLPSLKGRNSGDLFGAATAAVEAPSDYSNRVFRLAIGSPGYNQKTGMVQVFDALDDQTGWSQIGDDLTGQQLGEQFGKSLDVSSGEQPYLVIGSPGWIPIEDGVKIDSTRGIVRLYHWRSPFFGTPLSLKEWALVDNNTISRD